MTMTFANLVSVQSATPRTCERAYSGALLTSCERANSSASGRRSSHRKFIAVLLPERSFVTPIAHHARARYGLAQRYRFSDKDGRPDKQKRHQ